MDGRALCLPSLKYFTRELYIFTPNRDATEGKRETPSSVDKGAAEATAPRSPKASDKLSLGAVKCRRRDRPLRRTLDPPVIYRDEEVSSASPPSLRRRRRRDEALRGVPPSDGDDRGVGGREDTLLKAERAR